MELQTGLTAMNYTKSLNLSGKQTMEIPQILHMNGGEGQNSYYRNSLLQKKVIMKSRPILEESISQLLYRNKSLDTLRIAEMGCSSGPNALLPLWEIIQTMDSNCSKSNKEPPALEVFLTDLPGSDFNTIFRTLVPEFLEKLEKEKGSKFKSCFIGAMPGSFHSRQFPHNSLHFVHSSCSLHWISQVPDGLVNERGVPLNRGNICVADSSPESVQKAYLKQFQKDFTSFLKARSAEVVPGGRMVVTLTAKNDSRYCLHGSDFWPLIGMCLNDMAQERRIEQAVLDNWNIPLYYPSAEEMTELIEREESFKIEKVEEFEMSWDENIEDGNKELVFDKWERGKHVAGLMRAGSESMVVNQFGEEIADVLYDRLAFKAADYLEKGIGVFNHVVVSMCRK